uniref:Leucine-rich repeat LGI family, member 2a n=1 Tax=Sinocyclocheilus rhinocerous TaxID=307959 RepID=A0A673HDH9_9TELE
YFNMRTVAIISALVLCLASLGNAGKKVFKCPSSCSCSKESIICVGSSYIPRFIPNDVSSLSIVNGTFSEIKEAMFSHMPSLQLL